jgi:hypothetical protein
MVPEDNQDIAVSPRRVNRVYSRRDPPLLCQRTSATYQLTFHSIVHCHVSIAVYGRFPTQISSRRAAGYRGWCRGRIALAAD